MPGAGSSQSSTKRRPHGTARWRRRRQGRTAPPHQGWHAHRGASGRGREWAGLRDRQTEGRSEAPPENASAEVWGKRRSLGPRPPTFPPHPPHAPKSGAAFLLPLNLRSVGGSRTRICSCFAMAPEADAIRETAQSGGAPATAICWLGTEDYGGAGSAELYDGASARLLYRDTCRAVTGSVGLPLGQQLRVSQLTQPHTSRRGHAHCDPWRPT